MYFSIYIFNRGEQDMRKVAAVLDTKFYRRSGKFEDHITLAHLEQISSLERCEEVVGVLPEGRAARKAKSKWWC